MAETDPDYVREKLSQALDALATGTGTIHERVESAVLAVVMLDESDFADDEASRTKFAELMYRATNVEAGGDEGQLAATLITLTDEETQELATLIVWLYAHYGPA